jgi:hypothetical protein
MQPPPRPDPLPETLDKPTGGDTSPPAEGAATPTPQPPPAPSGDTTSPEAVGRYRIVRRLGGGGMGDVYLAHDPRLGREVAVKVPRFGGLQGPALVRERFLREARAAALVHHPNVCPVYDSGEDGGRPFVVMAYVEGGSLADRLRGRERWDDTRAAAELVRQAAAGVQALHDRGIVHRDLKPGNILLDRDGRPLVGDFGLARVADGEPLTAAGAILGTPRYMAPEQAWAGAGAAGPASDVYSLGVVLYRLLTGKTPSEAGPATGPVAGEVVPPSLLVPGFDPRLEKVVLRALAWRPEDRFPSAAALGDALDGWLRGRPASPWVKRAERWRPVAPAATVGLPRGPGVGRGRWVLLAVVLAACVALAVWLALRRGGGPPSDPGLAPRSGETERGLSPAGAAWHGFIDARVWDPGDRARRGLRLNQPGALPLRAGDTVRVEAEINPPAYLYVIQIDTEGHAQPLYPWRPGHWDQRPATESPRSRLSLPEEKADGGWEIDKGRPGMETFLLLARPTPLPPDAEAGLRAALAGLPPQTAQGRLAVVWFENGEVVRGGVERGFKSFDPKKIDDPVLRTQALLKEKLQKHFPYTWGVSYASQGG